MVREFARFARRYRIEGDALLGLVRRADLGIVDADLGGGIVKLRLARPNEGRAGGYRTVVAYRVEGNVFFLYGFAKNEQENIAAHELARFRDTGEALFQADDRMIDGWLDEGRILEIGEVG